MGNGISVLYKEEGRTLTRDALGQEDNLRYCIYLIKNGGHVTHALIKLCRTSTLINWSPRPLTKFPSIHLVCLFIAGAAALCHVTARVEDDNECAMMTEECQSTQKKSCVHVNLSTTNVTWTGLGSTLGFYGEVAA